ncbi:phage head-tail adapter protein [Weissella diestrammenae]|uniref:Phage head-tail adapter protein n=1 Tax=Weissella diestrammenae TaxID=1162633 RepID=A0A7G9T4Q5_9LACO|nr:phage head-tail adapter protein [Weissella diestrammenae]MCM0582791.1 phage head-tail adapter protein [Weissella diestrammenae]QNN75080.1 phage head-tail adapter protein [Weissella diestrammenae]
MKSTRTSVRIFYSEMVEVEPGVWEKEFTSKRVKAEQENVFQTRRDTALKDGMPISARFVIREDVSMNADYVEWKKSKYKIRSLVPDITSHFAVLELGELM